MPIPLADLERIRFAISAGSRVFDSPLGETRSGFNSVSRVAHPTTNSKSHCNFMDAIEDTLQQKLSGLSQQKMVIQVPMHCDNCRSKALKMASVAKGRVDSVALEGKDRDQVVVIGEDVDSVCLAKNLRKKFGHATIVSVGEAKEKKEDKKEEKLWFPYPYPPCPPFAVCDPYRDETYCTVM